MYFLTVLDLIICSYKIHVLQMFGDLPYVSCHQSLWRLHYDYRLYVEFYFIDHYSIFPNWKFISVFWLWFFSPCLLPDPPQLPTHLNPCLFLSRFRKFYNHWDWFMAQGMSHFGVHMNCAIIFFIFVNFSSYQFLFENHSLIFVMSFYLFSHTDLVFKCPHRQHASFSCH